MGQIPAKYFLPPAPYGASQAASTVNPVQPAATNPQTPLLPPSFTDAPTTITGTASVPKPTPNYGVRNPRNPYQGVLGAYQGPVWNGRGFQQ